MGAKITRRDFLNGVALTAGASLIPPEMWAAAAADLEAQDAPGYYPPAKTGLRGSHAGSFETMHAVRDSGFFDSAPKPSDTGETYDLVIVGGGISGLAAAHYFRQAAGTKARILVLDNHDDFGGHAKRNEFNLGGRLNLLNGGTLEIDSPRPYGPIAAGPNGQYFLVNDQVLNQALTPISSSGTGPTGGGALPSPGGPASTGRPVAAVVAETEAVGETGTGAETGADSATADAATTLLGPVPGIHRDCAGSRPGCPSSLMRKVRC